MNKQIIFLTALLFSISVVFGQVNYTALDQVKPNAGKFRYGINFGVYAGWLDLQTADVVVGNGTLPGIGIDAIRGSLPHFFLEEWNYEIRKDWYAHYESLGANDHLVFVGYPSEEARDTKEYCSGFQSELFESLYEPIWDNNNGTPYNENNIYAAYLYKTVEIHKDYVKYWEIMNEPDFTTDWTVAFGQPGQPGNWWENVPQPCDMGIKAPFFHYVRMMRISWEIIKSVDPDAYVLTGGIGNEAFLDALCRYTDNPTDGSVSADYPHKGGAYFDVLSYHTYPHFDNTLRTFNGLDWDYHRHSDRAANGVIAKKESFQQVLDKYGFDGSQYPEKLWLISEMNVPRKTFSNLYFGSNEGQINFTIKSLVKVQQHGLEQVYFYNVSDNQPEDQIGYEFNAMGQLKYLGDYTYPDYEVNDQGIALKTTFDFLNNKTFDEKLTNELNMPDAVDGGVFIGTNDTVAVLWAKTALDQSEDAFTTFPLPNDFTILNDQAYEWNYSMTNLPRILDDNVLALNGTPVFFEISKNTTTSKTKELVGELKVHSFPNPSDGQFTIEIFADKSKTVSIELKNIQGQIIQEIAKNQKLNVGKNQFDSNEKLTSGLYFLSIKTTDGITQNLKIVIL